MPVEVLSRSNHHLLRLRQTPADYRFAQKHLLISLLAGELGVASHVFPVAFTNDDGKANLVGLMGLSDEGNLFIDQHGNWQGSYAPAVLRMRPFSLISGENEQAVAIDTDSAQLSTIDGLPLFDGEAPGPTLKGIIQFLQGCAQNQAETDRALNAISDADILAPWITNAQLPDGSAAAIQGLFKIDLAKFDALEDDVFAQLRHEGALLLIYAHIFSLNNIATLERLAREKGPKVVPSTVEFSVLTDDYLKF